MLLIGQSVCMTSYQHHQYHHHHHRHHDKVIDRRCDIMHYLLLGYRVGFRVDTTDTDATVAISHRVKLGGFSSRR